MANVQVIAAYENYEKILKSLSDDLKKYASDMDAADAEILSSLSTLARNWSGEAADGFDETIRANVKSIDASLRRIDRLTDIIDEKVPKIKAAIEKLRGQR